MPSTAARVRLLGSPALLDRDGTPILALGKGKPLAILAYLLVRGQASRDELVALLWGDVPEARARNAFRQSLHRLRSAIGPDCLRDQSQVLSISADCGLEYDIFELDRAIARGDLAVALSLYRGDFLSGLDVGESGFEQWVVAERAKLKARLQDVLQKALRDDLDRGASSDAADKSALLKELAPLDPNVAVLHATTLIGLGRKAEAVDSLSQFAEYYKGELGAQPPEIVRDLAKRLGAPGTATSDPAARTPNNRAIGREPELARLLSVWRAVEMGHGSLVLIEGGPGIGKTALVDKFLTRLADGSSALLLRGRERGADAAVSYASLAEALRGALDAPGLSGASQHLLAEASRLLPQLRDQFDLPPLADLTDDAARVRFFEGVASLLDAVAYEQPVCVALDDFQNASRATTELLQYLVSRLQGIPILFLVVERTGGRRSALREAVIGVNTGRGERGQTTPHEQRQSSVLALGGLSDADISALVADVSGQVPSPELLSRISGLSQGFPFRVIELAQRSLAGLPIGEAPVAFADVLWGRLQRCTQTQQRLFIASALLDRPSSLRLLAAASHLSESNAFDALLSLEGQGLLVQRPNGVVPSHDIAARMALEGPGPAGIALLAGWAAEALDADGSGSRAELAQLFVLAGRRQPAFDHSKAAMFDALAAGAEEEAAHHFKSALSAAPSAIEQLELRKLSGALGWGPALLGPVASAPETESVSLPKESTSEIEISPGFHEGPAASAPAGVSGPNPPDAFPPTSSAGNGKRHNTDSDGSANRTTEKSWRLRQLQGFRPGRVVLGVAAAILVIAATAVSRSRRMAAPGVFLSDTLVVREQASVRNARLQYLTGSLGSPLSPLSPLRQPAFAWADSVRLPWLNARVSPNGAFVSIERMTPDGPDVYAVTASRRDTIAISTRRGDDIALGWSPDGQWLLVSHADVSSDGKYRANLVAYSLQTRGKTIVFDTSSSHSVVNAEWSPDGVHVAWVARLGDDRQQDIFLSNSDGSASRNLSSDASEDYSISWSSDGVRIAFTSERSGFAELYSVDLITGKLRRLTWDQAHADRARFSPDGRWIAYESTRGGEAGIYVMPSWGGTGRRANAQGQRFTLDGWRGPPARYVSRIAIDPEQVALPLNNKTLYARVSDQKGVTLPASFITWELLDTGAVQLRKVASDVETSDINARATISGQMPGVVRVVAHAGTWRVDTAFVRIGNGDILLFRDDFNAPLDNNHWTSLGRPRPYTATSKGVNHPGALVVASDREWESGVLSDRIFSVNSGLAVSARITTDAGKGARLAGSLELALVAADPAEVADSIAPQFLRIASISILTDAGRTAYSVERELFTEPDGQLGSAGDHELSIRIESDRSVSFFIDGRRRWRSTLKVQTTGDNSRVQVWLAGRGTGTSVAFDNTEVSMKAVGDPGTRAQR